MNECANTCFESLLLVLVSIYSETESLDHMLANSSFNFWGTCQAVIFYSVIAMFSIVAVALYIPTDSTWGSNFSTSSPVLDILNFRIVFYVVIFCFLIGMRWQPMVLICVSLMISDIEQLPIRLLPFSYPLWRNV